MVQRVLPSFGHAGASSAPWFGGSDDEKRRPKPFCGTDAQLSWWVKGAGTGLSVSQNSGHAAWLPCVSLLTSNVTVPVRPAKSNGCLGYIASDVTVPLSVTASRTWPLHTTISLSGCTVCVPEHVCSWVGDQASISPCPWLLFPVVRETPHTVPFN